MGEISATVPQLMSFNVDQMLRSKQALRRRLTTLPIAEKLRLLDELRERAVAIISAKNSARVSVREQSPSYGNEEL
jgi:hypothetical protein